MLMFHIIGPLVQTVDPKGGVHLLHLSGPDLGHGLDRVHAAVLGERHGDDLQCVGKAHMAYCCRVGHLSASWLTARVQEISAAPPPYTTRLSRIRLRMTHKAS
ncbi:hypothetical protein MG293_000202 [Ovis ammon polii]|uniref:Uncharacterized protein n=1 Tax=Ovis ammon polii TaxID=230172 RepID=A0AAD4YHU5_OVIAM|nr:hypothetical protein MG293_000202 [Ovis ammon polii]KAI4578798.1 hypothetical protein MJT46_000166 [Ovis ammon polii x Ovis aries]